MIGDLLLKVLKPLCEWAKAHSQQRVVVPKAPSVGEVWTDDMGKPVTVLEVDTGWITLQGTDGKKSTRYRPGFMKHFRHNDPSSATRPAGRHDCNRDAQAGFAAAHG